MINQFNKFTKHLASRSKPLRDLLSKDSAWHWGECQEKAFQELKQCLISAPILALYDPNKETKINADASSYGVGAVLLQKQNEKDWKPISYVSRALTDTETRYSQIEKEALAFTWACERFSDYILGKSIIGETDHKPLVPLLTTHLLDKLPPRIQRFKMRLMRFNLEKIVHIPGKEMYTSDALSRLIKRDSGGAPDVSQDSSFISDAEMNSFIDCVYQSIPASDKRLREIAEEQREDDVCKKIRQYCEEGWPERQSVPDIIKPYWSERGEISVVKGVILKGSRILIPSSMRLDVLDKLHQGHLGITKCRERAKQSVWWPGISTQIQELIKNCRTCARYHVNKPEPLIPTAFPQRPWQIVAVDFFKCENREYLLVVDYFSRYIIELCPMNKSKTATEVCKAMQTVFARFGIPERVVSDNGPPFNSAQYVLFSREWGFEIKNSSPKYPQSNGEAERAVQTVKKIMKKEKDIDKVLLAYRSAPLSCGHSPAELLMGRKIRTMVPIMDALLDPKWPDVQKLRQKEDASKLKQKQYFDNRHLAKPLRPLSPGTDVQITTHAEPGVIRKETESTRQYEVETPAGTIKRNRVQLVPLPRETSENRKIEHSSKPELNILSRPKRTLKLSLKARESRGLEI